MIITNKYIASLQPCKDRHDNYLKHYTGKSLSITKFFLSKHLSYSDKIWVWRRFTVKNDAIKFAIMCADSVQHIYNEKYPKDKTVSDLLILLKSIDDFDNLDSGILNEIKEKRKAANAAAHAAAHAAATAATYAAYVSADAADAVAAVATADAADAATYAAAAASYTGVGKVQEEKNIKFLIDIYKNKESI